MTIYAWILVCLFTLSVLGIPRAVGERETVNRACWNAWWHLVTLVFLGLYLLGG